MAAFSFRLNRNGRVLLGFALSEEDIASLRADEPIVVRVEHLDHRLAGFDAALIRADDVEQVADRLHLLPSPPRC